ncbi:hypothetical protein ASG28_11250 [Frigoribacterium sp. Leaf415]|nr:hypothetical protein ASG28_11250 [Frigoribacterium sp. Leaf415]
MDTVVVGLRVVLSLGVVLALLWVLQKRLVKGGRAGTRATSQVSVVARQGVGAKASVVVVDVEGERLVLGVTESSVTVLAAADRPVEAAPLTLVPSGAPDDEPTPVQEARVTPIAPVATPRPRPRSPPCCRPRPRRSRPSPRPRPSRRPRPPPPSCSAPAVPPAVPRRPVSAAARLVTRPTAAPGGPRSRSRARSSPPTRGVRPQPCCAADEPDDRPPVVRVPDPPLLRVRPAPARPSDAA